MVQMTNQQIKRTNGKNFQNLTGLDLGCGNESFKIINGFAMENLSLFEATKNW